MRLFNRFARDERGHVLVMAGLMLPIAIATVAAAVSYSSGSATRTSMQQALDGAVLAGVSSSDLSDPATAIALATKVFENNVGKFARSLAKEISAEFNVDNGVLYGRASGAVANPMGGVIGARVTLVGVRSAATKQSIPICILGLNAFDNGAFDVNGGPSFNADCAVQANSTGSSAMSQEGKSAVVKAKIFNVTGGQKTETYDPPPNVGAKKIADPYASLPFPAYAACDDKNPKGLEIKDAVTLSPGTYCGGIHVSGDGAKLTLQPGIYVMVDGPFWVSSGTVTGDRVTIAFTGKGSTLQVWGSSVVNLTSPTSGTYTNMQFVQDRDSDEGRGLWASVGGNSGGEDSTAKLTYDGVAYFPNQNFWVFGKASMTANSPSVTVVAGKFWTQGNATVNVTANNTRKLAVTGPVSTYGALLVH